MTPSMSPSDALSAALPAVVCQLADLVPLYTDETNPNKMSRDRYRRLVESIRDVGFLQPLLGWRDKAGRMVVIDGHHRMKALKELGATRVPVWLARPDTVEAVAQGMGVGMNYIRGEIDLASVTDILKKLGKLWEASYAPLSTVTGFSKEDMEGLLTDPNPTAHLDLDGAGSPPAVIATPSAKPFVIELQFQRRDQWQAVMKKLRQASGKSKDLVVGLIALLGLDTPKKDEPKS